MASSFSPKRYLSKIHAPQLLSELIAHHGEQALFEINDQTPRKLAVELMTDSIKNLDTSARLAVLRDLAYVSSITSEHTARCAKKLFQEQGVAFEPEIECITDHDLILYIYLRHTDVADQLAFLAPFYASKSYVLYEAPEIAKDVIETKISELTREYTRIANKDDNATEQSLEHLFLNNTLYIESTFEGGYTTATAINKETGELDRKHATRKPQTVRVAYLPQDNVVLIAGNISKQDKMIFLDTFLRIVCTSGYEEKVETYNLTSFKDLSFDFTRHNKGTPFIKATISSVTLSYADGKKRLRIALPSSRDHNNLTALKETLDELGLSEKLQSFDIANISFGFMFQNKDNIEKSIRVSCSLSPLRANLCPLFEYENYAKTLLKHAGIYEGWKVVEK